MDENITKKFTNIDQKVREAQIQLLYQQTKTGLIGSLIVALTACLIFWPVLPQWELSLGRSNDFTDINKRNHGVLIPKKKSVNL